MDLSIPILKNRRSQIWIGGPFKWVVYEMGWAPLQS